MEISLQINQTYEKNKRNFTHHYIPKRPLKTLQLTFFNNDINKSTNIEIISCEGKLSEYECGIAFKQMKN